MAYIVLHKMKMTRILCTILTPLVASIAYGHEVRVGTLGFELPADFVHEPAKGIDSSSGAFTHRKDNFEIRYGIGIGAGRDRAKQLRERWPNRIIRDEVLTTNLGKGQLIVLNLGDGTDKMAYFEAAPGVTLYANLGTGTHLEDFIKIVSSVHQVAEPYNVKPKAEQPGAGQPATQPADKSPVKDQPSTPTSKDTPR